MKAWLNRHGVRSTRSLVAYACCVAAWIIAGLVPSWWWGPFPEMFTTNLPRALLLMMDCHVLCRHANPVLAIVADYLYPAMLFLPVLVHAFRPRRWLIKAQVVLVLAVMAFGCLAFVAWIASPHP